MKPGALFGATREDAHLSWTRRLFRRLAIGLRLVIVSWRVFGGSPGRVMWFAQRGWAAFRRGGLLEVRTHLLAYAARHVQVRTYGEWVRLYDTLTDTDRRAIRERIAELRYTPLISVIMPVYETPEGWLRDAIESVTSQLYPHWELCIADDASRLPHVRKILDEYQAKNARIRVAYREQNGHIAAASNSALDLVRGEFVALLDHDDLLAEHALYMVAEELNDHADADLIYSDEDKLDQRLRRADPYFKPDWSPDLFLSQNMIGHLSVFRMSVVRRLGGFRAGYDGSQDYDLALRVVEAIPVSHVRHVPHVLYHWRTASGSVAAAPDAKAYAVAAAGRAIEAHCARQGISAEVVGTLGQFQRVRRHLTDPRPLVSLIIPTRDRVPLLRTCLDGLLNRTAYANLEVLVVDNDSRDTKTIAYLEDIARDPRVRVIQHHGPFNFAALNNRAARAARGEILGLINNDLEVISPDWLTEMVSHAVRPEVGAVGAMLYYPSETIQHAGVIVGLGGVAGHAHKGQVRGTPGYFWRATLIQNFTAVTAACMVLRRGVFEEVRGFDEDNLAVAFNDVDLCLRIRERGYLVVWTPYAELYHVESASRGPDNTLTRLPRFSREVTYMQRRWGAKLINDPYYNPNLTLESENFALACPPRARKPWKIAASAAPEPVLGEGAASGGALKGAYGQGK